MRKLYAALVILSFCILLLPNGLSYPASDPDPETEIVDPSNTSGTLTGNLKGTGSMPYSDSPLFHSQTVGTSTIPAGFTYGAYEARLYPEQYELAGQQIFPIGASVGAGGTFSIGGPGSNYVREQYVMVAATGYSPWSYPDWMQRSGTAWDVNSMFTGNPTGNYVDYAAKDDAHLKNICASWTPNGSPEEHIEGAMTWMYGGVWGEVWEGQVRIESRFPNPGPGVSLSTPVTEVQMEYYISPTSRYVGSLNQRQYTVRAYGGNYDYRCVLGGGLKWGSFYHTHSGSGCSSTQYVFSFTTANGYDEYFWAFEDSYGAPYGFGTGWSGDHNTCPPYGTAGVPYWYLSNTYSYSGKTLGNVLSGDKIYMNSEMRLTCGNPWNPSHAGFTFLAQRVRVKYDFGYYYIPSGMVRVDGKSNSQGVSTIYYGDLRPLDYAYSVTTHPSGGVASLAVYVHQVQGLAGLYASGSMLGSMTYGGSPMTDMGSFWSYSVSNLEYASFYDTGGGEITHTVVFSHGTYAYVRYKLQLLFGEFKAPISLGYSSERTENAPYSLGVQGTLTLVSWHGVEFDDHSRIETLEIDSNGVSLAHSLEGYNGDTPIWDSSGSILPNIAWDLETATQTLYITFEFNDEVPCIHRWGEHPNTFQEYQEIPFNASVTDDLGVDVVCVVLERWNTGKAEYIDSTATEVLVFQSGDLYLKNVGLIYGNYTYYYYAQDNSGNTNSTARMELNITKHFPEITFEYQDEMDHTSEQYFNYTIVDLFPEYHNVTRYYVEGDDTVYVKVSESYTNGEKYSIHLSGLPNGTYWFNVSANNTQGRVFSKNVSVTVYHVPELLSQTENKTYYESTGAYNISYLITDDNPGIYEIKRNGISVATGNWSSYVPIIFTDNTILPDGKYLYNFVATDNHSKSVSAVIEVNIVPWAPRVSDYPDGSAYEGALDSILTWTVVDTNLLNWFLYVNSTDAVGAPIQIQIDNGVFMPGITTQNVSFTIPTTWTEGQYVFTLMCVDTRGNWANDTASIDILPPPPSIRVNLNALIAWITVGAAGILAHTTYYFIKRGKKKR